MLHKPRRILPQGHQGTKNVGIAIQRPYRRGFFIGSLCLRVFVAKPPCRVQRVFIILNSFLNFVFGLSALRRRIRRRQPETISWSGREELCNSCLHRSPLRAIEERRKQSLSKYYPRVPFAPLEGLQGSYCAIW